MSRKTTTWLLLWALILSCSSVANAQKPPYFPCSETLDMPYGLTADISRRSGDFNERDKAMGLMENMGVNTVRIPMNWDNFCAPNGSFVYAIYDSVTETVRESPFTTVGIITHNFDRKRDAWKTSEEFTAYVRELIFRYRFSITDWEVMPGMNELWTSGKPLEPAQYFATLRGVYSVAKSANPRSRVIIGATAGANKFLDTLFTYGGHKYFDVMSFTSYGFPEEIPQQALKIRRMMYRHNFSKPVWLTNLYYGSYMNPEVPADFWRKVVPAALKEAGIKAQAVEIGVVVSSTGKTKDALNRYEIEKYLDGIYKSIRRLDVSEIANLDPAATPVLIPGDEVASEDIAAYMGKGGTVILDKPKWPSITHCGVLRSGSAEAVAAGAPSIPSYVKAGARFSYTCKWEFTQEATARYLTDGNLRDGDQMIPLLVAGDENFEGCVAALYKLKDNEGNAIILSRKSIPTYIDQEAEQAKRLGRTYILSFACGVDKVFWSSLRTSEKDPKRKRDWSGLYRSDFRPKPAATAYKTLSQMLPVGSTRPIFDIKDGIYLASWKNADGKSVWAVWTGGRIPLQNKLSIKGKSQYTDYLGNKMKNLSEITDGICYITGAENVVFE